jgi:hypothetical protein
MGGRAIDGPAAPAAAAGQPETGLMRRMKDLTAALDRVADLLSKHPLGEGKPPE